MRNIGFTIWMLFWWLVCEINEYIGFLIHPELHKTITAGDVFVFFVNLFIWIFVGFLLYEKKEDY